MITSSFLLATLSSQCRHSLKPYKGKRHPLQLDKEDKNAYT